MNPTSPIATGSARPFTPRLNRHKGNRRSSAGCEYPNSRVSSAAFIYNNPTTPYFCCQVVQRMVPTSQSCRFRQSFVILLPSLFSRPAANSDSEGKCISRPLLIVLDNKCALLNASFHPRSGGAGTQGTRREGGHPALAGGQDVLLPRFVPCTMRGLRRLQLDALGFFAQGTDPAGSAAARSARAWARAAANSSPGFQDCMSSAWAIR